MLIKVDGTKLKVFYYVNMKSDKLMYSPTFSSWFTKFELVIIFKTSLFPQNLR